MPATYDPQTGKIRFIVTPYEAAHEWAHVAQQCETGWLWKLHERARTVPFLGRVVLLLLELDAAGRALAELPPDAEIAEEAAAGLFTYILAITMLPVILARALMIRAHFKRKSQ